MVNTAFEAIPNLAARIPRWQFVVVLVGFPVLYLANSFLPWSVGQWEGQDHSFYIPFWISIAILHWTSVALVILLIKRARGHLRDVGLDLSTGKALIMVSLYLLVGLGFILFRATWPDETAASSAGSAPRTLPEQFFWLFMSLTAGFCEEFVYRGFAIRYLQGRGVRTWVAVLAATLAFVLVHGKAAQIIFPILLVAGLLFSVLFLWRRSLVPGICLHALIDLYAIIGG